MKSKICKIGLVVAALFAASTSAFAATCGGMVFIVTGPNVSYSAGGGGTCFLFDLNSVLSGSSATGPALTINNAINITNDGVISAPGFYGVSIPNKAGMSGDFINNGTISALIGFDVAAGGSIMGAITNTGSISATDTGIRVTNYGNPTTINNSGSITGTGFAGIKIGAGTGLPATINNSGHISGYYSIYIDPSVAAQINLSSGSTVVGDIYAPLSNLSILNGNFTSANAMVLNSLTVASGATFIYGNDATSSFVISNGISVATSFNNNGTLLMGDTKTGAITGNYIQSATGIYQENISNQTTYGKLNVSGSVTLNGALYVNVLGSPAFNYGTLTGMITAGSVIGIFSTVSTNSLLFTFTPQYTATQVNLAVAAAPVPSPAPQPGAPVTPITPVTPPAPTPSGSTTFKQAVAQNGNNQSIGAAVVLDKMLQAPTLNGLMLAFIPVSGSTQGISRAVQQTLPIMPGGLVAATGNVMNSVNRIVASRMENYSMEGHGDGFVGDDFIWAKPFASAERQPGQNNMPGYTAHAAGVVIGANTAIDQKNKIGIAAADAHSGMLDETGSSSASIQSYQFALYGSHAFDSDADLLDFNWQIDAGTHHSAGLRQIQFAGVEATSAYISTSSHISMNIARTHLTPAGSTLSFITGVDYTRIQDNGYTEAGAGAFNLNVISHASRQVIVNEDIKFNHAVDDKTSLLLNAGVGYAIVNDTPDAIASYSGAPDLSFATPGISLSSLIERAGVGIAYQAKSSLQLSVHADAEIRGQLTDGTVSAKARWMF